MNNNKITSICVKLLRDHPEAATDIADLMEEFQDVQTTIDAQTVQNAQNTADLEQSQLASDVVRAAFYPRGRPVKINSPRYELNHVGRGMYELAEWYGKTRGVHVSRDIYDRLAKRVEQSGNERTEYSALLKAVAKLDAHPSLVRTVIRFWKSNGLIYQSNSPYLAKENFYTEASAIWDSLRFGPKTENGQVSTAENPSN